MTGQELAAVLDAGLALEQRLEQIAGNADPGQKNQTRHHREQGGGIAGQTTLPDQNRHAVDDHRNHAPSAPSQVLPGLIRGASCAGRRRAR